MQSRVNSSKLEATVKVPETTLNTVLTFRTKIQTTELFQVSFLIRLMDTLGMEREKAITTEVRHHVKEEEKREKGKEKAEGV